MTDDPRLSHWKSEKGRAAYLAAYDAAMELWPVSFEDHVISTAYGMTHAVVSGSAGDTPLLLLPAATGVGAIQWFPNVKRLAADRPVFAVDLIGAPGKGTQSRAIKGHADYAAWLEDVVDHIGVKRVDIVGSSQGGWVTLNFAIRRPERTRRVALLAPAASLLPFRRPVKLSLRVGPYMPAWTAGPQMRASFGGSYRADDRIVTVMEEALRSFRYQQDAVFPTMYTDSDLRSVCCRTLVMVGDKEVIYDPEEGLLRARELIPRVETELVSGGGHLLGMELAEQVDRRVLEFMEAA